MAQSSLGKTRRAGFFAYAPLFIWIGVIFYLSTNNGSMSETSSFIGPLLHFFFPATPDETLQTYHAYIRKLAHLTEYAVLAFLTSRAHVNTSIDVFRTYWILPCIGVVALIASLDEFNQSFNSLRTGSPYDVLLDICGGVVAVSILYLVKRRWSAAGHQ